MNDLKKSINLPLLYEVRADAFAKAKGVECTEHTFSMVYHMDLLIQAARKDGLMALEGAAKEVPEEIGLREDIQAAVACVCDGLDTEDLVEALTARYWAKGLQGEQAMMYFMLIESLLRIHDNASPYLLGRMLMACLSDENAERYAEYKRHRQASESESTPMKYLLNSEPDFEEGGILIVKRLLEEEIESAEEELLKRVLRNAKESDLEIALKGLSVPAKKKLFSVIADHKADEYARAYEAMGPVRQIDVMAAMADLTAVFEEQLERAKR